MTPAKTPIAGETVYVVPRTSPPVRDPADRAPLPAEGRDVVWGDYWARRLQDGDVEISKAPKPEAAASAKKD